MEQYSILMSVYDKVKPDELKLSIESMLNQTYPPDQFVVVLDGPVGPILYNLIEKYRSKYPWIFTIIQLQENRGLASALNDGLKECRNDLVARMDSDDYSLPERCEKQVKTFMEDPELALLGSYTKNFVGDICNVIPMIKQIPCDMDGILKYIRRNDPFAHPAVMYKKSAVLACGGYDPELRRRQDYDLFSKMVVSYNYKAANLPEVLLLFRADEDYFVRNKNRQSCQSRIDVHKRIFSRGECSLLDFLYIYMAMKVSMIMPTNLYSFFYAKLKGKGM